MHQNKKDLGLASLYFSISTIITAVFIADQHGIYESAGQMLLSGSVAGAKWGVQLIASVIFLGRKKFAFMRAIGEVCLSGSVILLSIFLMPYLSIPSNFHCISALILCVLTMVVLYYRAVIMLGLHIRWFLGWLICLAAAILIQLLIFHVLSI